MRPCAPGAGAPHACDWAVHSGQRIRIGSLWLDVLSFGDALEAIERLAAAGNGGSVFTPNVDHLITAELDDELRAAYANADLSLADGQWVVWAAQFLGTPVPAKISGSDLLVPLARHAAARNRSMYLLGGSPGAVDDAARRLESDTGVRICGTDAPRVDRNMPQAQNDAIVARVAAQKPDFVIVGLGAPKQEIWIHRHGTRLRPAVLLGVGAAIDFVAGRIRRAPRWISRSGLEWLFRLAREPRRLATRYLVRDPRFVTLVLRTWREPRRLRIADRGAPNTEEQWTPASL